MNNKTGVSSLLVLGLLAGCAPGGPPEMPPPEVNVAVVDARPIVEWDAYDGRIAAIDSVELRPRVTGYLAGVHFREGSEVEKGALLFTVDDREYRAALASAQANTARAQTRVEVARTEFARSEKLKAARAVSEEELETRRGELRIHPHQIHGRRRAGLHKGGDVCSMRFGLANH